eukprot:3169259-Pyramimonas_sp.AAC.1
MFDAFGQVRYRRSHRPHNEEPQSAATPAAGALRARRVFYYPGASAADERLLAFGSPISF